MRRQRLASLPRITFLIYFIIWRLFGQKFALDRVVTGWRRQSMRPNGSPRRRRCGSTAGQALMVDDLCQAHR